MGACEESFIRVPGYLVAAACEAYLKERHERIANKREAMINRAMAPRWYRRAGRTREQAIRALSQCHFDAYAMCAIEGGYWANQVKQVLCLAQLVGSRPVMLCGTHALLLKDYMPK